MALQFDITTIGGESFAVAAFDSWLVRDLKLSIERNHKFAKCRQRLFSTVGEELHDERALSEFCPATLMLVKVSKTQPEIELFERWLENTPAWLQSATESIMNNSDFSKLRMHPDYPQIGHNNWGVRGGAFRPGAAVAGPVGSPKSVCKPEVATEHAHVLTMGRDVLSAAKTMLRRNGGNITISPSKSDLVLLRGGYRVSVQAEMEAVVSAIVMEPFVMLPYAETSIICAAMRQHPGLSSVMRDRIRNDRWFLYEALECDAELREQFLTTAGKTEINAWLWDREELHGRDFKNKLVVRTEHAAPVEAGKRGKHGRCCGRERNAKRPAKISGRRS